MKKKLTLTLLALVCALCCALGFAACDLTGGKAEDVTISESTLTMSIGETKLLTAKPEDAGIVWSSDQPTVASVNEKGKVTALDAGEAKIVATAKDGRTASCAVTVLGLLRSGVAGKTFEFCDVTCSVEFAELEAYKKDMMGQEIAFNKDGKNCVFTQGKNSANGTYVADEARINVTVENSTQLFTIEGNKLVTEIPMDAKITLKMIFKVKIAAEEEQTKPEEKPGEKPDDGSIVGKTFIFSDVTCEENYPYLDSMKTGMKGQEITFKADGTCVAKAGSMTLNGTYTVSGETVNVTLDSGSGTYTYRNGELFTESQIPGQDKTYTLKMIFRLKTEDDEPYFEELAGKKFAFQDVTSTTMDSSAVQTLRVGYANATITFKADGTYVLYNPSDNIAEEPNAYSRQEGSFSCRNGEGYLTIESMVSGGEPVEIPVNAATYVITLDGNVLTLNAAGTTFTYVLVTE